MRVYLETVLPMIALSILGLSACQPATSPSTEAALHVPDGAYVPETLAESVTLRQNVTTVLFDDLSLTLTNSTVQGSSMSCTIRAHSALNQRPLMLAQGQEISLVGNNDWVSSADLGYFRYSVRVESARASLWGDAPCTINVERFRWREPVATTLDDARSASRVMSNEPFIEQEIVTIGRGTSQVVLDGPTITVNDVLAHTANIPSVTCRIDSRLFGEQISRYQLIDITNVASMGFDRDGSRFVINLVAADSNAKTCTLRIERRQLAGATVADNAGAFPTQEVVIRVSEQIDRVVLGGPARVTVEPGVQRYIEIANATSFGVSFSRESAVSSGGSINVVGLTASVERSLGQSRSASIESQVTTTRGITLDGSVCRDWEYTVFGYRRLAFARSPRYGAVQDIPFTFVDRTEIEVRNLCNSSEQTLSGLY